MVTHYDLFAGIGGFSLALDTIFHEQENEHIFCEWEAFPTAVLKKHWPDATYYGDIADLVADTERTRRERELRDTKGQHRLRDRSRENEDLTILTGGFPCQPFSHAGRRQGTSDDRYKWPDMFAVIQNVKPDWVIAENVRGLVTWNDGMVLETVCADLESEGYEVQPLIIPAVAIGAPHRRDRVWIVAHRDVLGNGTGLGGIQKTNGEIPERDNDAELSDTDNYFTSHSPSINDRRNTGEIPQSNECKEEERPEGWPTEYSSPGQSFWSNDWREVALTTCHDGVDDGLPRWMDGVAISASKHRKERLKACGNAIVPQVAMEIFKAIKN